jgi:sugar O-acyltransferase (sialic acid O-acetyltransferase NeuD family)
MSSGIQDIAIVGAGGLGKEIAVLIGQINQVQKKWNLVGFFDDGKVKESTILSIPVLGGIHELNTYKNPLDIIIAIGNPEIKAQLAARIVNPALTFPVLIHPAASIGQQVTLGAGSIITAGCVLTVDIKIGKHVLVNLNSTIGHDVIVDDYSSVMPGAHLSGAVRVGKAVFIGTGVSVLQHVHIHDNAIIGAGAVVTKTIHAAETVVGIPARLLKK